MSETGDACRKDDGKPKVALIPGEALLALAALYTKGAEKYGENQWRDKPQAYSRMFSAMQRHAWAWWGGEAYDPTDGQHHLIAVAWNAFGLFMYEKIFLCQKQDDRPFSGPVPALKMTHTPSSIPLRGEIVLDLPQGDRKLPDYHRGLAQREHERLIEGERDKLPSSAQWQS